MAKKNAVTPKDTRPIEEVILVTAPPQALTGLFHAEERSLSFTGAAITALSKARTKGIANLTGDALTIGTTTITAMTSKIGIGEHKLLQYAVSAFTKQNSQNEKHPKLRTYEDTKDYARANGVPIDPQTMDTPEEQEKENKRAEKALFNFMRKLNKNIQGLMAPQSWTEAVQGKVEAFDNVVFLGRGRVTKDVMMLEFTQTAAEYMIRLPITETPRALYAIDDRKPNAYAIAQALISHYGIENNVIKNTERILKVETLLNYTSFPTQETLKAKRWSWERLVKEPFEDALDELYQKGLLKTWRYSLSGMKELTEEQATNILSYDQFVSLYIYFELSGYDAHDDRVKSILEKRAEAAEKNAEKRRKKPGVTAPDA